MSRQEIYNNINLNKNISLIKNKAKGRALIIGGSGKKIDNLLDFFDVIIVEDRKGLEVCPNPDFYIEKRHSLYKNHRLDYKYLSIKDTVVLANIYLLEELKSSRVKIDSHTLAYMSVKDLPASKKIYKSSNVECGLSANSPGLHLAFILGCEDVYGYASNFSTFTYDELVSYTKEVEEIKYVNKLKNLIRKRKQFIVERDI